MNAPPPTIVALVVAAGQSTRMGAANKLLIDIDGQSVLERTLGSITSSRTSQIFTVTGHDADNVAAVAAPFGEQLLHNPRFSEGMGTSLAAGMTAIEESSATGVGIFLADMPFVASETIDALVDAFCGTASPTHAIVRPRHEGEFGHPVIFGRHYFPELRRLSGDVGARRIWTDNPQRVLTLDVADPGVLTDIDTHSDLDRLRR